MSRIKLLGKNIKKYRELKGLSQEKLAETVELTREYIADVERGHKRISLKRLFMVADAIEVEIYKLFVFENQ